MGAGLVGAAVLGEYGCCCFSQCSSYGSKLRNEKLREFKSLHVFISLFTVCRNMLFVNIRP